MKNKFLMLALLALTTTASFSDIVINDSKDTQIINKKETSVDNIVVNGSGSGKNNPDDMYLNGYIIENGGHLNNNNNINLNGVYNKGILIRTESNANNLGTISILGSDSVGVFLEGKKVTFINEADGIMNISNNGIGIQSIGIEAFIQNLGLINIESGIGIQSTTSSSFVQNFGKINVINEGTGVIINNGIFRNIGEVNVGNGFGISAQNANVTNTGSITSNKYGVYLEQDSDFINNGTINVQGDGTGVYSSNSNIKNTGIIEAAGNNSIGIYLTGSSMSENTGTINVDSENGIGVFSEKMSGAYKQFINEKSGVINVNAGGTGIKVQDNAEVFHQNLGVIKGTNGGTGASINNSFFHNEGTIDFKDGTGIQAQESNIVNTGSITSNKYGVYLEQDSNFMNEGSITVQGDGTGVYTNNANMENTGIIEVAGNNSIGIYLTGSSMSENTGTINVDSENGIGVFSEKMSGAYKQFINEKSGVINVNAGGTGIKVQDNAGVFHQNLGVIKGTNGGTGASINNSFFHNEGTIDFKDGTGIQAQESNIVNSGYISSDKYGVYVSGESSFQNEGTIIVQENGTAVFSDNSIAANSSLIDSGAGGTGISANNNLYTFNEGTINSKVGVEINSGTNKFSNHFVNTGEINGSEYAVKFNNNDSVLELQDGSKITGIIEAAGGDNSLVVNGNVIFDTANNFTKLIASQDTVINGTINLNPSINSTYYSKGYSESKDISDISNDVSLGNLVLNGTINVGVDYDNIQTSTNKTGKILAESLNLTNGKVVLLNGGQTTNNIITESGQRNYGDQIRIESIVVSNKQQAVNPDLKFEVSGELLELEGWTRETVARIENNVTVLDEVYTNYNENTIENPNPVEPETVEPSQGESGPSPVEPETVEPGQGESEPNLGKPGTVKPVVKRNSVPRNRVDLDNVNRISDVSNRFLTMESKDMEVNEVRQEVSYTGSKMNSKFNSSNGLNYDYDVDSDGIAITTLYKNNEKIYSGITLGYSDNDVKYSNNDKENVDSFNINVFGRYQSGNWNVDGYTGYGYNKHTLDADWLGAGKKKSDYNSHVVKTGLTLGYTQKFGNDKFMINPNIGVDHIYVSEQAMKTNEMSSVDSVNKSGVVGRLGMNVGNTEGKIRWNAGINYEHSTADTFHGDRKMANGYVMEKLSYGKDTLKANVDADLKLTEKLSLKAGYEFENNKNFENHKIKTGFSYTLGEK